MDTKPWYLSKTVLGAVIAIVASAAGIGLTSDETGQLADHVDGLIAIVGGILAIYGRVVARKQLSK